MNLFSLFAKLSLDTSEYEKGINGASNSATSFADKIGNGLATAAKIGTAALAVAATGVTALARSSIAGYAEYEQLVGGIETLFGESQGIIMQYAENAYKTAGMSANEYMNTVTSFSASLLQGLDGDTKAATEYANMAITDMADNANKMGTSIESIQWAYQGFAKQNYTMLDNLKLGYGGTQAEMARLINDSGVLGDTITVTAETVNQVSFDKMIEAIHVVQQRMGITGTTAKEAATTIQGSVYSMRAAWSNLVVGIADDTQNFDVLVNRFVESASVAASNLLPRIETVLSGIGKLITGLTPIVVEALPIFIQNVLPSVIQAAGQIVVAFVTALANSLPSLMEYGKQAVIALMSGIAEIAPALTPITKAIQWLATNFQSLIPVIAAVVGAFAAYKTVVTILNAVSTAQAALNAVMKANPIMLVITVVASLVSALITLWQTNEGFRNAVGPIWNAIKNVFVGAWNAIKTVWNQAKPFFEGIMNAIKAVFTPVANFFRSVFTAAWNSVKAAWSPFVEFFRTAWNTVKGIYDTIAGILTGDFSRAWDGIKSVFSGWGSFFKSLFDSVVNIFKNIGSVFVNVGKSIVEGIWNGIKSLADWLWGKVKDFFGGIVDGVKGMLGIHSPSKVFAGIGANMAQGVGQGWDTEYPDIDGEIKRSMDYNVNVREPKKHIMQKIDNGQSSMIVLKIDSFELARVLAPAMSKRLAFNA